MSPLLRVLTKLLMAAMVLMPASVPGTVEAFPLLLLLRGAAAREAAVVGTAARTVPGAVTVRRAAPAAEAAMARPLSLAAGRGATATRAVGAAGGVRSVGAASARPVGKPTDVVISRRRHPAAAGHIEHAQRHGQPSILTVDRAGASQRRGESLRYINNRARRPGPGFDRDEYPPAMFREGGNGANVRYINRHDNRGAGKSMERQLRSVPDEARVRVLVTE